MRYEGSFNPFEFVGVAAIGALGVVARFELAVRRRSGARHSRNILQDEIEALSSGIGDRGLGRGEIQFDLRHGVRPAGPSHQRFDEWCGARLETDTAAPSSG